MKIITAITTSTSNCTGNQSSIILMQLCLSLGFTDKQMKIDRNENTIRKSNTSWLIANKKRKTLTHVNTMYTKNAQCNDHYQRILLQIYLKSDEESGHQLIFLISLCFSICLTLFHSLFKVWLQRRLVSTNEDYDTELLVEKTIHGSWIPVLY